MTRFCKVRLSVLSFYNINAKTELSSRSRFFWRFFYHPPFFSHFSPIFLPSPLDYSVSRGKLIVLKYSKKKYEQKSERETMAHLKSAIKRIGTSKKANLRNRARKSAIKTAEKKFRAALAANDVQLAASTLNKCCSLLDKAAKVGVIHSNKASNKKSRLMLAMNSIQA